MKKNLFRLMMALMLSLTVLTVPALAAQPDPVQPPTHQHDMSVECGSTAPVAFAEWDGESVITYDASNTAYVYLTKDVTRTEQLVIPEGGTLNLCFNGHTITYSGAKDSNAIWMWNGGCTLNLCDCGIGATGGITMQQGYYAVNMSYQNCALHMYGGKLVGGSVGCIYNAVGTVVIDGGELAPRGGCGIGGGSTTINGGTFSGNVEWMVFCAENEYAVTINGGEFTGTGKTIFFIGGNNERGHASVNLQKMPTVTGNYDAVFSLVLDQTNDVLKTGLNIMGELEKPAKPLSIIFDSDSVLTAFAMDHILLTTGWSTYMQVKNPAEYFSSDYYTDNKQSDKYQVRLSESGEAELAIPVYAVTKTEPAEGSFAVTSDDKVITECKAGKIVEVEVTVPDGKLLDKVTVIRTDNNQEVSVTDRLPDYPYCFTMPAAPVTVSVSFKGEDLTLKSIEITDVTLTPAFSSDVTEYTATVSAETDHVVINAEATESHVLALYMTSDGRAAYAQDVTVNLEVGENVITFLGYKNSTVYSQYKVTITREKPDYTVTFDSQEGSEVGSQTVTHGETVQKPDDPTKDGLVFGGWYTDADCTAEFDFSTAVTGNMILYAKWTEKPVTPPVPPVIPVNPSAPTHPPVVAPTESGSAAITPASPKQGDNVVITPVPDRGYEAGAVTVTDQNGNPVQVIDNGDGTYRFVQPAGRVRVEVRFVQKDGSHGHPALAFSDLDASAWYYESVDYALENGLMGGYGNGKFAPDATLSRAMLAQVLCNIQGRPAVTGASPFTDVAGDAWYADAVVWASANGLVDGYGDGRFGPDTPITREQMAVMLWRYARYRGCDVSVGEDTNILSYRDIDKLSDYAFAAVQWAVGAGILTGYEDGTLKPNGLATRAEVAAMLMRYCENVMRK